jgi:hypothetical protein
MSDNVNDRFGAAPLNESDNRVVSSLISLMCIRETMEGSTEDHYTELLFNRIMPDAEGDSFIFVGQAICDAINRKGLPVDSFIARNVLDIIYQKMKTWDLWKNDRMNYLVFQALEALSPIWLYDTSEELELSVDKLFRRWAEKKILKGTSSKSRIALAHFLAKYIHLDPSYRWWNGENVDDGMDVDADESMIANRDVPLQWLGELMIAGDIRVRFVSSILFPDTFQYAGKAGHDIMFLYSERMTPQVPYQIKWFVHSFSLSTDY